ncbi:MAG: ATP-binding cassette domain-containing protein [Lachnospiraceae bacterium]|nr:ATP-binding cassette domain-containing protein [Lachnospiraceae bacterium]
MKYMIETNTLGKKYGEKYSVKDLNLKVRPGCVYGFLGPNGAGKSTTMKMLLGLVKPTAGEIQMFGNEIHSRNRIEVLKRTGSLIEAPSYYGHLNGRENLEIVQTLKQVPREEIDEVLRIVRLEGQQKKKVREYSLGMKQRLGLAAALLGRPKLLLLDEPTNGLDPAGIQEMRELISDLPKHYGMTVMVSSHLLSEIDQMATDVGIIDRGKLIYQGSLRKLHEKAKGSIRIQVLNQTAAMRILEEHGESFALENGVLVLEEREEVQIAELVALLAGHGAQVTGVSGQQKSLEDIFLTLTGKQVSL